MRVLTTEAGRLRLGWRLGAFVCVTVAVAVGAGALLPSGPLTGAEALLAGGLIAGWWMLALDGRGPAALGFYVSRESPRELVLGVALGTAIGSLVVLVMAALGGLRWSPDAGDVVGWLRAGSAALLFLAIPAAAEEALLRGYPLQALGEAWGGAWAVAVTAVAFGLLHLRNPGVGVLEIANVTAAGLLLGAVYVRTLSLWWATGVHLGWNWAHGFIADLPVSGLDVVDTPLYDGRATGPAWLGGGAFGPEGSVVATLVVLGATAALVWRPWLGPGQAARAADPLLADVADGADGIDEQSPEVEGSE